MAITTGARWRRISLCGALALLLALALAPRAFAHAVFRGSEPVAEAVLPALPGEVLLRFNEPVGPLSLVWHLPDGGRAEARASARPDGLAVTPPPAAGRGSYVLSWRVASTDGHPIGGALVISWGEVTGVTTGAAPGVTEAFRSALPALVTRGLAIFAMILAVGAGLFAAAVAPLAPRARRAGRAAAGLAPPLAALAIGAYGLDLLGLPMTALATAAPWQAALGAPRGWGLLLGAAAVAPACLAFGGAPPRLLRPRAQFAWALLAWALGTASLAVSGHAAAGEHRSIGQPLMALHGALLIFWIGGLLPLLAALPGPQALAALRRFSALALPAVLLLGASGAGLIALRFPGWAVLAASGWGRLLAVKLLLVAAMLLLATRNRAVLTPALQAGHPSAARRLRRSIGAELGLGAAVLLCAMGFRLTPPPQAPVPLSLHLHGAAAMVDLTATPAPPGRVQITATVLDGEGVPLLPRELRLTLTDPTAGLGPIRVSAIHDATADIWRTDPVTLPTPGPWQIRLALLIDTYTQTTLTGTLAAP